MLNLRIDGDESQVEIQMSGSFKDIWCDFAVGLDAIANALEDEMGEEGRDMFLGITSEYIKECMENPLIMKDPLVVEKGEGILIDFEALRAIKMLADAKKEMDDTIDHEAVRLETDDE